VIGNGQFSAPINQRYGSVRLFDESCISSYLTTKLSRESASFVGIAGREGFLCSRSKDAQGSLIVLCLHCSEESAAGIFG